MLYSVIISQRVNTNTTSKMASKALLDFPAYKGLTVLILLGLNSYYVWLVIWFPSHGVITGAWPNMILKGSITTHYQMTSKEHMMAN